MRVAFVFLGLCALACAEYQVADKEWLSKEKDLLRLFNYINQPSYYKDFIEISETFKFEGHWDQWTEPEYAKEFFYHYEHDFLPQGEVFSIFYPEHLEQAISLFKVFYYAKDYETFYKTAVWARNNVNVGMFIYSFSVAIVQSHFTKELILPPIYEIFPHYFFNDEVIYTAQQYKQHYWGTYDEEYDIKDPSYKGYTIPANYSGWYLNLHPEQSMSYFTEDIAINSYYWYANIYMPWWLPSKESAFYKEEFPRSEYYYFYHQQLLARYYLERLSNGMGEIPHFSYDYPFEYGYYPSLTYTNGLKFPTRPNHAEFYYHGVHGKQSYPVYGNLTYSYTYVHDYETRLRDALDKGYIWTHDGKLISLFDKDGFKILCNLVESNYESPNGRFYGDLQVYARHLLGYAYYSLDEYKVAPAALEHFETSLRDPAFWMMYKRIMYYFYQYQEYTGPYEKEELYFDGVKIEDFTVDRLYTYFEYFYSDISNAVYVDEKEFETDSFEVRAKQYRLNHKPFNYKIEVNSEKATDAFVKVFIGPKYDEFGREIDIENNRMNFFELDRFHYKLSAGKTVIERSSKDSYYFSKDRTTYKQLYEQIMAAYNGDESFKYYNHGAYYAFPQRYMLPKGDFGGKTYQFYVIVSPYHSESNNKWTKHFVDTEYSLGWPFDRPIETEYEFFVPNSYFKDVVIYHKTTEDDINTTFGKH